MLDSERKFTPSEAAVASGVTVKTVHREIDEGPLKAARKHRGTKRSLREEDLFYLAVAKCFDKRLVRLTNRGKDQLHDVIVSYGRRQQPQKREFPRFSGALSLDLKGAIADVQSKLALLDQARKMVVEDPEIRGGEPCIRGTRIGVYEIASMIEQGVTEEELLAGYPSLQREQFALSRIYAHAYPRRGRPPRHPWHKPPWREVPLIETHR